MTPHIQAAVDDYASTVLMPGDPLRAKWIADNFLQNVTQVNSVRNCLGYTGTYKGKLVSVQASGMGQSSLGIYATELFKFYKVENIIRVGTCGAFDKNMPLGHMVVAMSAFTESSMSTNILPNWIFNPCCDFNLLNKITCQLEKTKSKYSVGAISSTDWFYKDDNVWWKTLRDYGVLGVDMETHILYLIAMKYGKSALTINAVSDNLDSDQHMNPEERQTSLNNLIVNVLETL
jgi:purine-nucleoside phosphorylase